MITECTKSSNGKLLAAVIGMLMVVCAVAVVAMPADADGATKPTVNFAGVDAVDIADVEDLTADIGFDAKTGVLTVTEDTVLNITGTLGSATAPAIEQIILKADLQIQGSGSLYVANSGAGVSTVIFAADGAILSITDGVIVNLDADGDQSFVINNGVSKEVTDAKNVTALLSVTDKATLNITHTLGKSTWYNADGNTASETYMDVDNATVNFNESHSVQGVVLTATNKAAINLNDTDATGMVLKDGSVISDSTVALDGAKYAGLYLKGTVTVENGSSVTVKNADQGEASYPGINVENVSGETSELKIDATSSVATTDVGFATATSKSFTISGSGSFSGDLTAGKSTETTKTYTLNGVTVGDMAVDENITVAAGTAGVVLDGTVDLSKATVSSYSGMIIGADAKATLKSDATGYNVLPGATVSGPTTAVTPSSTIEATTTNFATVAGMDNVTVYLPSSDVTLSENLVIGNGTTVDYKEGSNGGAIVLGSGENKYTITGSGAFHAKVKSVDTKNFFELNINGSYAIADGSVELNGSLVETNVVTLRSGEMVLTGNLSGELSFVADQTNVPAAGTTVVFKDFTVSPGAVMTLVADSNVSYESEGNFYLYGRLNSAQDVAIDVQADSTFKAFTGANIQQTVTVQADSVTANDKTVIDLDDAMMTLTINDDLASTNTYSQVQTLVIADTLNITPDVTITVMGQFIVNEGVTLTIQNGATLKISGPVAKMIVNGNVEVEEGGAIIVEDGEGITVTGAIESDGAFTVDGKVTIEENGKVTIDNGDKSVINVTDDLTVKAGGELEIRGEMSIAKMYNSGTVVLNGANLTTSNSTINMAANGAVVDIQSFTADKDIDLIITDDRMELGKNGDKKYTVDANAGYAPNKITFNGDATYDGVGIRGVTVTEASSFAVKADKTVEISYSMSIAGTAAIVDESEPQNDKTFSDSEKPYVIGIDAKDFRVLAETEFNLGSSVEFQVAGKLTVAGTMNAVNTDSVITNTGVIDVTGMITVLDDAEIKPTINAASYEATVNGNTYVYYTTLNNAIANGATEIVVHGTVKVTESVTIPTGTEVKADTGAKMEIGEDDNRDVVVTVENGATVRNFNAGITVYGTLDFANAKDNKSNIIISDVSVSNEPGITYTNIYTALGDAVDGDVVTITKLKATQGAVVLNADITVPSGVTLVIPAAAEVQVNDDVTVTVDGTVQMLGTIVSESTDGFYRYTDATMTDEKDEFSEIVVNGTLMSMGAIPYATQGENYGYYIAGAYYWLVSTAGNFYYVTPVAQAAAVSNDVTNGAIEIYGANTAGDVDFTGDSTTAVTVTLMADASLTASSVTLSYATLDVDKNAGVAFTGTVDSAVGSVTVANIDGIVFTDVTTDGTEYLNVTGSPVQADEDGADATMTVATGNVSVSGQLFVDGLEEFAIAEGATMTVGKGATLTATLNANKEITVDGTLVATNGGKVIAYTLNVSGTFTVAAKTDSAAAGEAEIYYINVGISVDDDGEYVDATAATATLDGVKNLKQVAVSAESTVTGAQLEDMKSTEFYVEDALWMTVYVVANNNISVNDFVPGDLVNSAFSNWKDAEGNAITTQTKNPYVGATGFEKVYAVIDYEIYTVFVLANQAVDDVFIDGSLMTYGMYQIGDPNVGDAQYVNAYMAVVAAGDHTISYTLKNGYSGDGVLTVNGEKMSGLTFSTSDAEGYGYSLTLTGFEKTGYVPESPDTGDSDSADTGMTITDYLLIVLVVLIVVMAIIVAMRLMRS